MYKYIKIARPDHWIKNIFIVPGIVVGLLLMNSSVDAGVMGRILFGLLLTCLTASANYVINEWLDADYDQYHPVKKNRPVVTQNMSKKVVIAEYLLLAAGGLGGSLLINMNFFYVELWLLIMGLLYNVKPFRTKDIVYLDVLSESINNIIRLLLGWFLITPHGLPPVSIMLGYWMAGAFLMGTKRLAEYRMIGNTELAGKYRKSFQHYTERTLLSSSFFYAMCATFFIGIFMVNYRVEYLVSMPFLFLLFAYYLVLAFNKDSVVQKPEKLYKEKKLLGMVLLFAIVLVAFSFINISDLTV